MATKKGDIVEIGPCPICKRNIKGRGVYNHNMAHVREGEMTVHTVPLSMVFSLPYEFRLAIDLPCKGDEQDDG